MLAYVYNSENSISKKCHIFHVLVDFATLGTPLLNWFVGVEGQEQKRKIPYVKPLKPGGKPLTWYPPGGPLELEKIDSRMLLIPVAKSSGFRKEKKQQNGKKRIQKIQSFPRQ
jgi:hypothetical protein